MLKFLLSRYLDRFERTWGYDASYMRQVLAVSPVNRNRAVVVKRRERL